MVKESYVALVALVSIDERILSMYTLTLFRMDLMLRSKCGLVWPFSVDLEHYPRNKRKCTDITWIFKLKPSKHQGLGICEKPPSYSRTAFVM